MTIRITVHAAVIEWSSEDDIEIVIDTTIERLRSRIREAIEKGFADRVPEWEPGDNARGWVDVDGKNVPDWDAWYDELHERTAVPWVTFGSQPVEIEQ